MRAIAIIVLFPVICVISYLLKGLRVPDLEEVWGLTALGYAFMIAPALILAVVDRFDRPVWVLMAVGFVTAMGSMFLFLNGFYRLIELIGFGAIGAFSALMCWLITRSMRHHEVQYDRLP